MGLREVSVNPERRAKVDLFSGETVVLSAPDGEQPKGWGSG